MKRVAICSARSNVPADRLSSARILAAIATLTLLYFGGTAMATTRPSLQFLRVTELPHSGLKFKLMPGVAERPAPPPETAFYTITLPDGRKDQSEMMAVTDLWRRQQIIGAWRDESGNELTLSSIDAPLPTAFALPHTTREEFDRVYDLARRGDWDEGSLKAWFCAFIGVKMVRQEIIAHQPSALQNLVLFEHPEGRIIGIAFRFNPRAAGQAQAPANWFAAVITLADNIDRSMATRAIREAFITSLSGMRPISTVIGQKEPARFQSGKHKPSAISLNNPRFIESRRQVLESIRNLKGWWSAETDNYIFLSDLKSNYVVPVKNMQANIESLRKVYATFIPARNPIEAVSVVRIFANESEYLQYVGDELRWTGGVWMPGRNELVLRPLGWGGARDQRTWFYRTLYHEGFHQYVFYAMNHRVPAPWFNEGHAKFFETARFNRNIVEIDEDQVMSAALLKYLGEGPVDLERLVKLSYRDFVAVNEPARVYNYTIAWALIYYLHRGAPLAGDKRLQTIPARYIEALAGTGDADRATDDALKDIPMAQIEIAFTTFWRNKNLRGQAARRPLLPDQ